MSDRKPETYACIQAWDRIAEDHDHARKATLETIEQLTNRIEELEADRDDQAVKNYEQAKRIAELEAVGKTMDQLLALKDIRIEALEAGLAESCRDMRDEVLGQCPIAGELQARLDAVSKLPEKWRNEWIAMSCPDRTETEQAYVDARRKSANQLEAALEQDDE